VQVDMQQETAQQRLHQLHQRRRLAGGAGCAETAVGIHRIRIPAMDTLIGPGADAGGDHQVHPAGIGPGIPLGKPQGAEDTAGFVPMHATGDQGHGQIIAPVAAVQGEQRVAAIGRVVELAVLDDVEVGAQALDDRQHVVGVAALDLLAGAPEGFLGRAPGRARGADGIGLAHAGKPRWEARILASHLRPTQALAQSDPNLDSCRPPLSRGLRAFAGYPTPRWICWQSPSTRIATTSHRPLATAATPSAPAFCTGKISPPPKETARTGVAIRTTEEWAPPSYRWCTLHLKSECSDY